MSQIDSRVADLVQAGKIRLALFLPQYAKDAVSGELRGVGTGFLALEIVRVLASRLGVTVCPIELPTPTAAVERLKTQACDLAFLGIEPSRATEVDFAGPIVQFDYTCLVPGGSWIGSIADVDKPGISIAVVCNHASTMRLRRIANQAELVECELPDQAFDLLRAGSVDAFALPREQLIDYSLKLPGSRVLSESYGINRVAIAVPKGQAGRLSYFSEFSEDAKISGLVQSIIDRGALHGFEVAACRVTKVNH